MYNVLSENVHRGGPDDVNQMARYTIHVPEHDNEKNEIPHVLAAARQALGQLGFHGRTVTRASEADWKGNDRSYDTEYMSLIMVDAPWNDRVLESIKQVARGVKQAADQEGVYVTRQPIETFVL